MACLETELKGLYLGGIYCVLGLKLGVSAGVERVLLIFCRRTYERIRTGFFFPCGGVE